MNNIVDYYKLLHVQRDAPSVIIKASYRTMMQKMQHHPDLGGDEQVAQQLNLAVSVLCNPDKRAQYDQALALVECESRPTQTKPVETSTGNASSANAPSSSPRPEAKNRPAPKPASDSTPVITLPTKSRCPFCKSAQSGKPWGADKRYSPSRWCLLCGGAATPITLLHAADSAELRQIHRQAHTLPAMLWHHWPQSEPVEAMLVDFSPAGCALDCVGTYSDRHILRVKTDLFDAICQVCFCKPSTHSGLSLLGLEFITLNLSSGQGRFLSTTA